MNKKKAIVLCALEALIFLIYTMMASGNQSISTGLFQALFSACDTWFSLGVYTFGLALFEIFIFIAFKYW